MRRRALAIAALLAAACSNTHLDAPPPASSAGLPTAPPNALGAQAASQITTTPTSTVPRSHAPEDPDEPGGGAGAPSVPPAAPAQPNPGGVPL